MIDSSTNEYSAVAQPHIEDQRDVEDCQALAFWLSRRHCVIVWRDGPRRLRPVDQGKRIRDLRVGDEVFLADGEPHTICSVGVYR